VATDRCLGVAAQDRPGEVGVGASAHIGSTASHQYAVGLTAPTVNVSLSLPISVRGSTIEVAGDVSTYVRGLGATAV